MQHRGSDEHHRHQFATTRWSVIRAAQATGQNRQQALTELCQTYWFPVYAFIRKTPMDEHSALDATQEFFARVIERDNLQSAHEDSGRFRNYLLTAVRNFLINEHHREAAAKRGGGLNPVSLELADAESRWQQIARNSQTPDREFDRQWALAVLEVALERARADYAKAGNESLFNALQSYLPVGRKGVPYRRLADQLKMSEAAVRVAVHRLRKRYGAILRDEIAGTIDSTSGIDDEIHHLFDALGR